MYLVHVVTYNMPMPETKTCTRCQLVQPVSEFYRRSDTGRLKSHCKTCLSKANRSDKGRERNRRRYHQATEAQKADRAMKHREWREANREHHDAYQREYRQRPEVVERRKAYNKANSDKIKADRQRWYQSQNAEINARRRIAYREKVYGISAEDWNALFDSQGRVCAICKSDTPGKRHWSTDHCHTTGKVRGILCAPCNLALGALRDDPATVMRLHAYLLR